ncbi:MAG TPA: cysteine desulfurase [Planctomycetota bacterium]|nr:cysteine desulfurase [Planctomycetota bacterium]
MSPIAANPAGAAPTGTTRPTVPLDVARIREDFPILKRKVHGKRLVYLDNAATTQKPNQLIDAIASFYRTSNANIHRGIHKLAEEATQAYEGTRKTVAKFIGGADPRGVVFTRNSTEALNLVAYSWGRHNVAAGDEILLTEMEHHSNLVPWIILAKEKGAVIKHIPLREDGTLRMEALPGLISPRTRIVSVMMVSNALGTINPVEEIAAAARKVGAIVVLDAAQAVPHLSLDVQRLDFDFLAFSAHKMLGPTGVGVLVAKPEMLRSMDPFLGGGEMIREVWPDHATWNEVPHKFEAGTPNITDVAAFSASIGYLESIGMAAVRAHEMELTAYAMAELRKIPSIRIFGPEAPELRSGLVSFVDLDIHPHDLSQSLDLDGIAIRAGHHCAQLVMRAFNTVATARASFYIYNDRDDVDALVESIRRTRKQFGF